MQFRLKPPVDRAKRIDTHWKSAPKVEQKSDAEPEEIEEGNYLGIANVSKKPKSIEDDADELAMLRRAGEKIRREHRRQKQRPANPDGSAPKTVIDYLPHPFATLRKLTARKQQDERNKQFETPIHDECQRQ